HRCPASRCRSPSKRSPPARSSSSAARRTSSTSTPRPAPSATIRRPAREQSVPGHWLRGRRIVLGVSGGIAAYKAVEVCRQLMDAGAYVSPVLTENATRFVGPLTFSAVASEPARLSLYDSPEPSP